MRLRIVAVGRAKSGPEAALIDDYLTRFNRTGRALGLGPAEVVEVDDRKSRGPAGGATALAAALPSGAALIALDERGRLISSPDFARILADRRDLGTRDCAILIGGADGLSPALRARADVTLSFGKMVWPHLLARVMLAEQLYRASTILAGGPYHRA